jgi:hypothetical protein
LTAVGTPDPDPDVAALNAMVKGELVALSPVEQGGEYNRLLGDLVALERLRRNGG